MTALPSRTADSSSDRAQALLRAGVDSLAPVLKKGAQQLGRATAPVADHVRKRPVIYIAGAVLLGAAIGLLASRKARHAVSDTLSRSWDVASGQGGQAAETLRELLRR
jgi:hypothetical protein